MKKISIILITLIFSWNALATTQIAQEKDDEIIVMIDAESGEFDAESKQILEETVREAIEQGTVRHVEVQILDNKTVREAIMLQTKSCGFWGVKLGALISIYVAALSVPKPVPSKMKTIIILAGALFVFEMSNLAYC